MTKTKLFTAVSFSALLAACAPSVPYPGGEISGAPVTMRGYSDAALPDTNPLLPCYDDSCRLAGGVTRAPSDMAGMHHHGHHMEMAKPAPAPFADIMMGMHKNQAERTGVIDSDFLKAMIPHHQAAVDMAALELTRGCNRFIQRIARDIYQDQEREIAYMRYLLDNTAFTSDMNEAASAAFPKIMDKMHEGTPMTETGDIDVDFVRSMIPHHQGAIDMAYVVLEHGDNPKVRRLAEDVIRAQTREINQMQDWLNAHGK